jgi:hypothetical protein
MDYYKLYIQKMGETEQGLGYPVKETISDFSISGAVDTEGIFASQIPFKPYGDVKDVPSNDWHDRHGRDEYASPNVYMKAYDTTLTLCCKGSVSEYANKVITSFVKYLTGLDGTGSTFKIYDTYNKVGRQNVRFTGLKDKADLVRSEDGDILVFSIGLTVNDPVTDFELEMDGSGNVTGIVPKNAGSESPYFQASKWLVYPKGVPVSDTPTVSDDALVFSPTANVSVVTEGEGENAKTKLIIS